MEKVDLKANMEMWEDEIVAEVRAVCDAYAQRFAYDVRAICRDLKRSQDEGTGRSCASPPNRPS